MTVVQRIERRPPKLKIRVRFPAVAPVINAPAISSLSPNANLIMSKFQRRIRQAESRGVHILHRGNCPDSFYKDHRDKFDIYVESEGMLGPRDLALTKRQAANLAYQISVAKRSKITIEVQATTVDCG